MRILDPLGAEMPPGEPGTIYFGYPGRAPTFEYHHDPEKLNALSAGLMTDYDAALTALSPGGKVRVIRLRGAGRACRSGYDLSRSGSGGGGSHGAAADGSSHVPADRASDDRTLARNGESLALLEPGGHAAASRTLAAHLELP